MKNVVVVLIVATVLGIGFLVIRNSTQTSEIPSQKSPTQESSPSAQNISGLSGKVLAGNSALFLEFNKADYDKALSEDKIILLDFYANWCPICRGEAPAIHEGFNNLTTDKVIGFRVNFKDSDTDKDEEQLAKDFKIPYQHTKVILKNGQEFSRSTDSWTKQTFDKEINLAL